MAFGLGFKKKNFVVFGSFLIWLACMYTTGDVDLTFFFCR